MEHLSNDHTKTVPISMRIVISYAMKQEILLCIWWKINANRISKWRENHIVEQITSEERNKSKRARLWESQSGIRVGKLTTWVRSFEFTRSISSTRIGKPVLMMDVKVSKDKHISRCWMKFNGEGDRYRKKK